MAFLAKFLPEIFAESWTPIYVLIENDKVVCFSTNVEEMVRTLQFYRKKWLTKNPNSTIEKVGNTIVISNVYDGFFFTFERPLATLKIVKTPFFRTRLFQQKEAMRK